MSETDSTNVAAVTPLQTATEFLANERTFLAWVRTSIALISLGFVVAKFSLWLEESSTGLIRTGSSMAFGIGMMVFGGVLVVLAAWRYHTVNAQIERGGVSADRNLIVAITIMVVALSMGMAGYLLKVGLGF